VTEPHTFTITAEFEGSQHTFPCRSDQTVLAAAEAAGVTIRAGATVERVLVRDGRAAGVDGHRGRRQAFGEADPFLERLLHLFVVERVGGAVDEALAVGDGRTAPAREQFRDARRAPLARGRGALGALS